MSKGLVVDIDDTLADTASAVISGVFDKFGYPIKTSPAALVRTYSQPGRVPLWKSNTLVQEWVSTLLNDRNFLLSLVPVPQSEYVHRIVAQVPIAGYLTSRLRHHKNITKAWLDMHKFPSAPVICRDRDTTHPQWKLSYLQSNAKNTFGLIDDTYEALWNYPLYHGHRIWFNRYGKTVDKAYIHSARSWEEVANYVSVLIN